jgi:hypothetical protein
MGAKQLLLQSWCLVDCNQCDRIGINFARWAVVYFWLLFENVNYLATWVGLHFGPFFHKLIWSP